MAYLQAPDAVSGKEGSVYTTIDGSVEEAFEVKNISAELAKNKADLNVIGSRNTQKKTTSLTGTGTMTIRSVTSKYNQMMLRYQDEGIDTYFEVQITNDDKTSSIGRQIVGLSGVNIDSTTLAMLDADADFIEYDVPFTFDKFIMPEVYVKPSYIT